MREGFFNQTKKWVSIDKISIIALLFFILQPFIYPHPREVQAAAINTITTTLTDSEALDTESRVVVVFTPATLLIVTDVITIYLGDATGGVEWEDDDTDQDLTDVVCAGTGYTFSPYTLDLATATSPFKVSATVTAVAANNEITCTIGTSASDAPNNPTTPAGSYPVAVVTNDDSGAGAVYVANANDVTVSTTVLPNLSMLLDSPDGVYCTGTNVISCNLGVVLTTTDPEGDYDINVGTNAASGATITIAEDGDLGTITDFIEDSGAITAGTDEYGITVSTTGTWTFAGIYLDNDSPIESTTTLATSGAAITEAGNDITVLHEVAIDSTVAPGLHSHTVTYTVSGTF